MRSLRVFAVVVLLALPAVAAGPVKVAVVASRYDSVEKWLQACRIPYTVIKYADLNDPDLYIRYDALFFPSGMEPPPETSINILSRGTSIQGVTLREGHYELDRKELARKLRAFIDGGGSAYFSGYSWDILHGAYEDFSFFYGFPYIGSAGTIDLRLEDDLLGFVSMPRFSAHMPFSGWVAVKSIGDADVLAGGRFQTPRGEKEGPVIARLKRNRGEAYYTGYYAGEIGNPIMRFLIIRVAFRRLLTALEASAGRWDQTSGITLVDMLLPGETSRRYAVPLRKGRNTIYFGSDAGFFQADVYSGDEIIASRQTWDKVFSLDVRAAGEGPYGLRVYPAGNGRHIPFAISVKHGPRLIPYFWRVVLVFLFLSVITALVFINRFMNPRKYSGRAR
ncbi:MAG TPA: hypothetical protein VLM75_13970 [Spirochaetota bacterium]|nr:hypothetical protein [Spirochaetota bacterium]